MLSLLSVVVAAVGPAGASALAGPDDAAHQKPLTERIAGRFVAVACLANDHLYVRSAAGELDSIGHFSTNGVSTRLTQAALVKALARLLAKSDNDDEPLTVVVGVNERSDAQPVVRVLDACARLTADHPQLRLVFAIRHPAGGLDLLRVQPVDHRIMDHREPGDDVRLAVSSRRGVVQVVLNGGPPVAVPSRSVEDRQRAIDGLARRIAAIDIDDDDDNDDDDDGGAELTTIINDADFEARHLHPLLQLAAAVQAAREAPATLHLRWPLADWRPQPAPGFSFAPTGVHVFTGTGTETLPAIPFVVSRSNRLAGQNPVGPPRDAARRAALRELPWKRMIELGIAWLRDHQHADGSWSAHDFASAGREHGRTGRSINRDGSADRGADTREHRVAMTGLAVLAILAGGYPLEFNVSSDSLKLGIGWLVETQRDDGGFCDPDPRAVTNAYPYAQAFAAWALIDAWHTLRLPWMQQPAQLAVDHLLAMQNRDPDRGWLGWRYGVNPGDSDSHVTGLVAIVLAVARRAGLAVPDAAGDGAVRHFDDVTGTFNGAPRTTYIQVAGSRAGTGPRRVYSPAYDAANAVVRALWLPSVDRRRRDQRKLIDALFDHGLTGTRVDAPRADDDKPDFFAWNTGALAAWLRGDRQWKEWSKALHDTLKPMQRLDVGNDQTVFGSFDPSGKWGATGGRVYATAIHCLTLATPARYPDRLDD